MMTASYLELAGTRTVESAGAGGTSLQAGILSARGFGGAALELLGESGHLSGTPATGTMGMVMPAGMGMMGPMPARRVPAASKGG